MMECDVSTMRLSPMPASLVEVYLGCVVSVVVVEGTSPVFLNVGVKLFCGGDCVRLTSARLADGRTYIWLRVV